MLKPVRKWIILPALVLGAFIFMQAFAQQSPQRQKEEKPKNLKVLPKNISNDSLHALMKVYARSLGVRCGYCHQTKADDPKHLDFASDAKPQKDIARNMMRMVEKINKKYIGKMSDFKMESVTCVSCHMGRTQPVVSVDSLQTK